MNSLVTIRLYTLKFLNKEIKDEGTTSDLSVDGKNRIL